MATDLVDGGITPTKVILAPIREIVSYQIIEHELKRLEDGFDGGIMLNLCIAFGSMSVSLFATGFSAGLSYNSVPFAIIITSAVFCLLISAILCFLHLRVRREAKQLFSDIRGRKENIILPNSLSTTP